MSETVYPKLSPISKTAAPKGERSMAIKRELKKEDEKFADLLTCAICCSIYHHPLMLSCQHTFCLACVAKSCSENYQDDISCAVCRQTSQFPRGVLAKLPRNHVVVDMLEKCGFKDCLMSQKQVHKLLTDTKQRRHPTRLPTDTDDHAESGSSSEETDSDDSTINESVDSDLLSEDSDEESSSSEDDDSDDSSSSSEGDTATGTISEEYTLDSDTDSN